MEISFKGKKALVTGAGKGIGRGVAKRLVELGATTVALSRTQADLDSLKAEVPEMQIVQCDLADWDATRKVVQSIPDVDLLVNNAGISYIDNFLEVKKEDLDIIVDVNYKAVFNVAQVVANSMVERKCGGAIVNVSSVSSFVGSIAMDKHAVYSSLKAAVDKLTQIMAHELGPYKIRVNAINPTIVMTELGKKGWSDPAKSGPMLARTSIGRFAEVSDVTDTIMYLLSDKAAMVHGVTLPVDGGLLFG